MLSRTIANVSHSSIVPCLPHKDLVTVLPSGTDQSYFCLIIWFLYTASTNFKASSPKGHVAAFWRLFCVFRQNLVCIITGTPYLTAPLSGQQLKAVLLCSKCISFY